MDQRIGCVLFNFDYLPGFNVPASHRAGSDDANKHEDFLTGPPNQDNKKQNRLLC